MSKLLGRTGWRWYDSIQLDSKYNHQKRFNLWLAEGFCELKVLRDEGDIRFVSQSDKAHRSGFED